MALWIALLALVVAAAALIYGWRLQQENEKLRGRLDRYNRTLFATENDVRALHDELAERTAVLQAEMMQRTGTTRFTPDMTARTALLLHPQVNQILAGFHLGGCSSCAIEPDETLAQICTERGIEVDTLMDNLNMLVANVATPQSNGHVAAPTLVKLPNMTLEI